MKLKLTIEVPVEQGLAEMREYNIDTQKEQQTLYEAKIFEQGYKEGYHNAYMIFHNIMWKSQLKS